MSKLPPQLENPIDSILLNIGASLLPALHTSGHTPNTITTYSLLAGLASVYYLYHGHIYKFAILYAFSYFFDCIDGQLARQYNMTSKFGDLYDHVSDLLIGVMLVYVSYVKYKKHVSPTIVLILLVMAFLMNTHIGCQQMFYYQNKTDTMTESLDRLTQLCLSQTDIHWTRYFGVGTFNTFVIVLIVYLHHKKLSISV